MMILLFKKKTPLFFVCLLAFTICHGQRNVVAAGNTASGSGGSATYTVGQIEYHQHIGTGETSLQGVQQPYEITVLLNTPTFSALSLMVYPNPSTEVLHLISPKEYVLEGLSYQLFDMNGKEIRQKSAIGQNDEIIQVGYLRTGYYMLSVIKNNTVVKSFKILKK